MAETTWAVLRELLVERYADFKARLTRRLGSEELASESLHETWLRLHRQDNVGPVHNPPAYLQRIALNIAMDHLRAENRLARRSEIKAALEIADPAPGPAREAEGHFEVKALESAMKELPERARAILIASRLEGATHQVIAKRLGISRRTVLYELERAVTLLDARLEKNPSTGCASEPPESS
jgi:RNA polymerase sigma-70 factor (ECF subfamily)